VTLAKRNDPIETLSANGPDQSLAECVGLGRSGRRLQHTYAEAFQFPIDALRKDRVPVVNQEAIRMIEGQRFPNCWMVHSAVGCSVTLKCKIRREPISIATNT
jgi:hypothetical protein